MRQFKEKKYIIIDYKRNIYYKYKVINKDNVGFVYVKITGYGDSIYFYIGTIVNNKFLHTNNSTYDSEHIIFWLFNMFFLYAVKERKLLKYLEIICE